FPNALRLRRVVARRATMRDRAVRAVSRAHVAEDHEGGGAVLPTLANVGATRLLADRMQVERAHQLLEMQVVGPARRAHLEPTRLPLRERLDAMASEDLMEFFAHGGRNLSAQV